MSGKYERYITNDIPTTIGIMNTLFGNHRLEMEGNQWVPRFKSQVSNIVDEINELEDAVNDQDNVEILDAVGDIVTFVLGGAYLINEQDRFKYMHWGEPTYTREEVIAELRKVNDVLMSNVDQAEQTTDDVELEELKSNIIVSLVDIYKLAKNNAILPDLVDLVDVMKEITRSNHTKICEKIEHRDQTMAHYQDLGIDVYHREIEFDGDSHWVVYSSSDQQDINGKMYRKDKFLKCVVTFRTPNLASFVNN